ncbi:hypothetical protein S7711_08074 [Stachybotrys chartarum IBT 7711]|uniref:Mid2 domain-containing protein n=1 Tax=Stachybotrys chartarum (strain CBS 109288 / IBT 7711) TaxID=1280523 RepID=A0A084AHL7_STACB|nr:hypothetical protein S7711_08074 [Stachybotrys chartarum IBT 7711]KFA48438.1 hypothetical protein S40293_00327 [Stachybotrys chartarum IBT 40293]
MRSSTSSHALLLLAAAANIVTFVSASPYPRGSLQDAGYSYLFARQQCASMCGADNQFCCSEGEVCATLEGARATCVPAGGSWGYTTTWTETRTFTSTIMTHWAPAPEPTEGVDCIPQNDEQEACGNICCAGWQTCAYQGQCSARPGLGDGTTITFTTGGIVTTQYSAPFRITGVTTVTTSGVRTETQTVPPTTTASETGSSENIGAGGGDEGGGGGLSAGAIAGIVIGSLAGVALLLLLCFCCIARGLWNAIFNRRKRTERSEVVEERYSRHGSRAPSAHTRRDRHGGWFGGPASAGGRTEKKKSSGGWWLGLAGGAATLLALLNLRRDKKPDRRSHSRYSDSYYSYSGTSPSSSSSGRRTHRTRGSRAGSKYARSAHP